MKSMKRLFSMLLAIVMVLSLVVGVAPTQEVYAADENPNAHIYETVADADTSSGYSAYLDGLTGNPAFWSDLSVTDSNGAMTVLMSVLKQDYDTGVVVKTLQTGSKVIFSVKIGDGFELDSNVKVRTKTTTFEFRKSDMQLLNGSGYNLIAPVVSYDAGTRLLTVSINDDDITDYAEHDTPTILKFTVKPVVSGFSRDKEDYLAVEEATVTATVTSDVTQAPDVRKSSNDTETSEFVVTETLNGGQLVDTFGNNGRIKIHIYHVTYEYAGEYPEDIMATLPSDDSGYFKGDAVDAQSPSVTSMESTDVNGARGEWTFNGWSPVSVIINGDATFVGSWTFTPYPTYGESYVYDTTYPDDVMATLPSRDTRYYAGDVVYPANPSQTVVLGEQDGVRGEWAFDGWDSDSVTIVDADVQFVGSWHFTQYPVYTEQYVYSGEYNDEIMATLPTRAGVYYDGDEVIAEQPAQTEFEDEDGYWRFNGWDADSKIVSGADVTFTGTWRYDLKPVYTESYAYEGELPDYVMASLPTELREFKEGTTAVPQRPSAEQFVDPDNDHIVYTFVGWNVESIVVGETSKPDFVGTWRVEELPYAVSYRYDDTYIDEVMNTLPATGEAATGSLVTPVRPSSMSVSGRVNGEPGKWLFKGWEPGEQTINHADIEFVGSWEFKVNDKFTEYYQYDKEYPEDVMATIPTRHEYYYDETWITPAYPAPMMVRGEVDGVPGVWTFDGWDNDKWLFDGADITFTGTWSFNRDSRYTEIYRYDGELPQCVMDTLPRRAEMYYNGTTVTAADPTATVVVDTVDGKAGKWNFQGWNATTVVVQDADVEFIGTWRFVEDEAPPVVLYGESYKYDVAYPEVVMITLPTRSGEYADGESVTAAMPTYTTVRDEQDGKVGSWVFNGWKVNPQVVNGANVEFVGSWEFIEDPKYGEHYTYDGEYPDGVMATLPTRNETYYSGTEVKAADPTAARFEDANAHVVWFFDGWKEDKLVVEDADITFVGTWTATEVPTYGVSYSYDGEYPDAVMSTLPADENRYIDGDEIVPVVPSSTAIEGEKDGVSGTWVFSGWDAEKKTINGADVTFVGLWSFTATPVNTYTEKYEYAEAYPDNVMATLPTRAEVYADGTVVTPAEPSVKEIKGQKDGKNGTWTFKGWDATSKVVNGADVVFKGTWEFVEDAPVLVNIAVKKTWVDHNNTANTRPSTLTIHLFADGKEVKSEVLSDTNGWACVFNDMPKTTDKGIDIVYTVREDAVPGYSAELKTSNGAASGTQNAQINFEIVNSLNGGIQMPEAGSNSGLLVSMIGAMMLMTTAAYVWLPKRKHDNI